jgi:carboxyl-terminal processing protease
MIQIINFMKRNYKVIVMVTALSAVLWSFVPTNKNEDPEKDKVLIELLTLVLERGHYSPVVMDDAFSKKVYDKYLQGIDPTKRFFLQSDLDEFSKYENLIDNLIRNKELVFFELTNTRMLKRIDESKEIYKKVLETPFDFSEEEELNVDYEGQLFASNKKDLFNRWRKQLKLSVLSIVVDKQRTEEAKSKKDAAYIVKSLQVIEEEARETVLKSLNDNFNFMEK